LVNVLLASPLAPELVDRIASVDSRLKVTYRADLLGQPRYAGDHYPPIQRTPPQVAEWNQLLADAEVMLDVDQPSAPEIVQRAPRLRWVQSSSAGVGEWIRRLGLVDTPIVVTNAAGMHARPLAEFAVFAMLYFAKRWPHMAAEQRAHHWERCAIDTLTGKTLGIIGLGRVGQEVAQLAQPFGLRVIGTRGSRLDTPPAVERVYPASEFTEVLSRSDYLVLSVPHTPQTEGMLGAAQIATMKRSAVLINIARGVVVDENAMIEALRTGGLAGAALDVFRKEPLPAESPLWDMPNVLVTPHSMSTAYTENAWLTDLFCENLRRYLDGEPLRNEVDKIRGY
jgi:glyoxylate/hydroxypyruvate reductase